jgi:hypothetical protein
VSNSTIAKPDRVVEIVLDAVDSVDKIVATDQITREIRILAVSPIGTPVTLIFRDAGARDLLRLFKPHLRP